MKTVEISHLVGTALQLKAYICLVIHVCRWLFGEITCQLYAMCGVLFGLCSLTNLTALSSVCCLKVCFPTYGEGIMMQLQKLLLILHVHKKTS